MLRTFMLNGSEVTQEDTGRSYPFSLGPLKVSNVLCADGSLRTARLSAYGADTFFSIPASVSVCGKTVSEYVTVETLEGFSTETPGDPAVWKFVAYQYGKNAGMLPRGAYKQAETPR